MTIQATVGALDGGDGSSGSECVVCKEATSALKQFVFELLGDASM